MTQRVSLNLRGEEKGTRVYETKEVWTYIS